MTRTMFDAVTASNLPTNGALYGYYVDGLYANETAVKARTPGKIHVPITIGRTAARKGLVLDVEPGDATNAEAIIWCLAYSGSNRDLTCYTNMNNFAALRAAFQKAGVTEPNYWVANYDDIASIPAGAIAKQFRGDVSPGYDESVVADYWPGVDAAPVSTVKPASGGTEVTVKSPQIWRGVKLDPSTIAKLKLAEAWAGFTLSFPQGSYSSGVSASAGTHDGGGAVDVHCNTYSTADKVKLVHYLRAVGFAAWHRPYNWDGAGGSEHIHCEEIGNPNLSSGAKSQIVQWNNHQNGLANHGADNESVDVSAGRPAKITAYPFTDIAQPKNSPILGGPNMLVIVSYPKASPGWKGDFVFNGVTLKHIPSVTAYNALTALGVQVKHLNATNFTALFSAFGG